MAHRPVGPVRSSSGGKTSNANGQSRNSAAAGTTVRSALTEDYNRTVSGLRTGKNKKRDGGMGRAVGVGQG